MNHAYLDSPIGRLRLVADDGKLLRIEFDGHQTGAAGSAAADPVLAAAAGQLGEYFAGGRRQFQLPLAPAGTPFQQSVWAALLQVPYGEVRSYRELATALGRPSAVRAVGAANGRNPLPIVIPCHRVIGSDGTLTGYAGGLSIKAQLLQLEGVLPRALFDGAAAGRAAPGDALPVASGLRR